MSIPDEITKDHLLAAIEELKREGYPKSRGSKRHDLVYEGQRYPPKEVVRRASIHATGEELWDHSGGVETNRFLEKFGFEIRPKGGTVNSKEGTVDVMGDGDRPCWFVGAWFNSDGGDQTPRFIEEGIWQNGYTDKFLDRVNSVQPGDRIAIKSTYTQKNNLPFDNKGNTVSVMPIKAIGTVTKNLGDGRTLEVDWEELEKPRHWYFYTYQPTIWKVIPGKWKADALIAFAFDGESQDYEKFMNAPYWRDRFGDKKTDESRFEWTEFYKSFATKLLAHKDDRTTLVSKVLSMASSMSGVSSFQDQYADGSTGPIKDICPFTTMAMFNRGITEKNRIAIAGELGRFLGVEVAVPDLITGAVFVHNQKSWFFKYEKDQEPGDIDRLWALFESAIRFAEDASPETQADFSEAYDAGPKIGWMLSIGLYWARPEDFLPLDTSSRDYIQKTLGLKIPKGPKGCCSATDYLALINELQLLFQEEDCPVHSFQELSVAAYGTAHKAIESTPPENGDNTDDLLDVKEFEPYHIEDIIEDGCFLEHSELETLLERLLTKQNLILQGPPGTGKTWLAKRLAYALMECKDKKRVRAVQFHPNLSYEDFIRGWRPSGEGKLMLEDGPFLRMVETALQAPTLAHVLVIEEINRGNPAQIFGEMLTLLEADKRKPSEALELSHSKYYGETVYIPENVYVIGTMNIADRSLALVDLALRRRFAFADLIPQLGTTWRMWVEVEFGIDKGFLSVVQEKMAALNSQIKDDPTLGSQFQVGHSYVTPSLDSSVEDANEWFRQVVETEIFPLLSEYWFDAPSKATDARKKLLEGI